MTNENRRETLTARGRSEHAYNHRDVCGIDTFAASRNRVDRIFVNAGGFIVAGVYAVRPTVIAFFSDGKDE